MIVDPGVVPGLLLLAAELAVLAGLGYVVVRVALRQEDELSALAQGLVVGPALWGIVVNFVMYAVPGLAGAAVGWVLMLGLAGGLAWRSPGRLGVSARTLAGFAGAVLVLGWVGFASRQLLSVPDATKTLGLAASIRSGAFPVALPSQPETTGVYHYGASLLAGVLAPPGGPDLAFVSELLGVYAWVALVLVLVTGLRQRGSWLTAVAVAPLLLGYGLTTFLWHEFDKVSGILWTPVPAGLPEPGLRAALAGIYWAPAEPAGTALGSLPDIWKPQFTLGYALAFVVLAHAALRDRVTWQGSLTLAGLVGFLGLLVTTLAPVVLAVWASLEAWRLVRARLGGRAMRAPAVRSAAGLTAAGLLLLFGGGALSGISGGDAGSSGLVWGGGLNASDWSALGDLQFQGGGVGLLRLGPLAVALGAVALARRDRLVLALAVGGGLLTLAWLALEYPARAQDLQRIVGHARSLALMAMLLALSARLAHLGSRRWRYGGVAVLAVLVVWPTVVAPARSLGRALGEGVEVANAGWAQRGASAQDAPRTPRRYPMPYMSSVVAGHIRERTDTDARVLDSTGGYVVLLNAGRANNQGLVGVDQIEGVSGPEYLDALHYLEPVGIRRLGLAYVYATDAWVAALPARARGRLANPELFDLLARDGDEALYRVRPGFLALETAPHPNSYEALRAAVPQATELYLPPSAQPDVRTQEAMLRVASALPQARLVGAIHPQVLHARGPVPWQVSPLGAQAPELVVLPLLDDAWDYPPRGWREIWRNPPDRIGVYAPTAAGAPPTATAPPPISVRLADVQADAARLTFTATFEADASREWTGQDWVLVPIDSSPLGVPHTQAFGEPVIEQWFAGQAAAAGTTTHTYVFDARDSTLAIRTPDGALATVQSSQRTFEPGAWMLAFRRIRRVDHGVQEAALIAPVLGIEISTDGAASYRVYDAVRGWRPA